MNYNENDLSKPKYLEMKFPGVLADLYLCESAFSKMNFILNEYRTNLTQLHLEDTLMAACSSIALDFDKIVAKLDCQISH